MPIEDSRRLLFHSSKMKNYIAKYMYSVITDFAY